MHPPTTIQELIDCILQSGLLAPAELRRAFERAPLMLPEQPLAVAAYLVQLGLLTAYQAGKILVEKAAPPRRLEVFSANWTGRNLALML